MNAFLRKLITVATIPVLGMALSGVSTMTYANNSNPNLPLSLTTEWDKTFPESQKVDHHKVTFQNRYGITLVGDLYIPKIHGDKPLAALAISGPFGAVKEQSSGLYAQTLAEAGFVTLAFDPSYTGESGGQPRNVASPDINTEDFSAGSRLFGATKRSGSQPYWHIGNLRLGWYGIKCCRC
ncbi:alpha/beta hydrolase [Vibrio natriegens]|uniref:alpha/beta hydrolase n=1 Tax=Vibrio natriegens TaxID=691 RepID=UPI0035574C40